MAVTHVVGQEGLEGVQQLGGIWKIYLKAVKHRCELLSRKTLWIQSKMVAIFDQNPYQNNLQSRDKLTIKGLPLHMKNDELKTMLESKSVVLCSPIKFSLIRDEAGQFTNYKNGDRFLYCEPLPQPIPRQQRVGDHNCYVHHHGKKCNANPAPRWDTKQEMLHALEEPRKTASLHSEDMKTPFPTIIQHRSKPLSKTSEVLSMPSSGRWPQTLRNMSWLPGSRRRSCWSRQKAQQRNG